MNNQEPTGGISAARAPNTRSTGTIDPAGVKQGWVRRVASRYPLAAFLVIVFGLSYPLMSIPILAQYDVIPGKSLPPRLGLDMERAASVVLVLSLVVATFVVTALVDGKQGTRALLRRMGRWRVGVVWWLIAAAAMPLTTITLAVLLGDSASLPSTRVIAGEVLSIAIALFLINLWEEAAWAGFLQARLERRHNFFIAAALTAVPFAAVHLPLRIITGEATTPAALGLTLLGVSALGILFRSMIGMVQRGARNSILLAATVHTFFNRSNNVDGIAADVLEGNNRMLAALLAMLVIVVVLGICIRKRLTLAYRANLDAAEGDSPKH